MGQVLCAIVTTYLIVLFARAIMSWLPPSAGALATVTRVLFDLSFMVLIFGLYILRDAVC